MQRSNSNITIKNLLLPITLVLVTATIPLPNNLNSIAIVSFVVACLIQQPLPVAFQRLKKSRLWILPVIYFLWTMLTWFWDSSGGFTIKEIERYAILFFLPPALAIIAPIPYQYIRWACNVFIIVTVAVCLLALYKSYQEYLVSKDYRVFYYHYLSQQVQLNAIFLSNFCLASIIWLFYFSSKRIIILLKIPVALFLTMMIFVLSSKMILLLLALSIPLFIIYYKGFKTNIFKSFIALLLLLLLGVVVIEKLPYLKWRIRTTEVKMYEGPKDNHNGVAIRLLMWKTGWDLIKERPFTGYGLKGASKKTLEQYKKRGFILGYEQNYHTHNQYIESALMAGFPALILLIAIIGMTLARGFTTNNILLIAGSLHFALHSVIESTFEVQQEFIFFMFFIFLFYYHPPKSTLHAGEQQHNLF